MKKFLFALIILFVIFVFARAATHSVLKAGSSDIGDGFADQYELLVKNGGTLQERCTRATLAADAYTSAGDSDGYRKFEALKQADCGVARAEFRARARAGQY